MEKIPSQSSIAVQVQTDFFQRREQLIKGYIFQIPAVSLKVDGNEKLAKLIRLKGSNDFVSHKDIETVVPTVDGKNKSAQGSSLVENLWTHARKVF
jgi:hypothetical protein